MSGDLELRRQRGRERQKKQRYELDIPVDIEHGKVSTYRNWRCFCEPCRQANAAEMRMRRRLPIDPQRCPSLLNHARGCRCQPCVVLKAATRKRYRENVKHREERQA